MAFRHTRSKGSVFDYKINTKSGEPKEKFKGLEWLIKEALLPLLKHNLVHLQKWNTFGVWKT
jgi:hypothetical protein